MNEKVYGVLFDNCSKPYHFKSTETFNINDMVIVDTEKGEQFGKISIIPDKFDIKEEYKEIVRLASKKDEDQYYKNLRDAQSALKKCREFISELKLDMYAINAVYNFDRSQLLINFSADDRIDFRELAKKLAGVYRTRIELRQIGARDKAKQIGGIGVCGEKLCCSRFLKQMDSISMNKAKNQGLSLNPNKINGSCGRLLCCLCYEDDEYTRCSEGLLPIGSKIKVNGEEGTIVSINILERKYKVLVNDEKIDVLAGDVNDNSKK